ncbi:hypothetical protein PUN28_010098 [Cardiocondyla obscurior]|uniref:Uncharacterized protein n=1 Tax=Cardiocondyla obscurior TaxID=286306 RepID=A0AAW2FS81_9HYME
MIALWTFNAMAFFCNWMLVSSSVLKDNGSLRIFKELPNDIEYVIKRHGIDDRKDDIESKDRRSTMGTSFIRFGRSQAAFNGVDNPGLDGETDSNSKVSRHPRWKSPDIVIRFGRSNTKTINGEQLKRGRNDLNFIRFGRNAQVVPADLVFAAMCSTLVPNEATRNTDMPLDVLRLVRLCNSLDKITGVINLDGISESRDGASRHE